ncbi:MAG: bifunctional phosphopantothenoylcysteine decarboxylase/phosphopantothenate--cysteine ligase CoaBC [Candidatus Fermentithermobacillus carboniphilus]|uniref:Coenzyme A biosynthesis bifunctional protein CoaBC n=1 Tax=Candidatus Fermentithermobacillus carboniphilus TaxID=3085328 RepID=A0AAT9LCT9_9FIRM|nr:MAG: bifunctional phosphopantothenoylcysteine decarboxylase/phosphopantothenate--cysteine ligase CoaBC [Candidatus Fermentithermobacillus carboniphilus]
MLKGKTVVIGVSGGIAAYKAVEVVSRLKKLGAETHVIMTRNATKLVAPITFRTISNQPVVVDMFEEPKRWNVEHIALAEKADLFLICPATANVIGKIACGIADDYLTTTVMACTAPKLICPAMNHNMYENPVLQGNLRKLRELGYRILEPEYGQLASGAMGKGRLPEPEKIVQEVVTLLNATEDLRGLRLLVTAGPTREWLDPVRYISNPSTGKMGYAIAEAASRRGAQVYLVSGPVNLEPPSGVHLTQVETTAEMLSACLSLYDDVDAVIAAAAPCDFRPREKKKEKVKKTEGAETLELLPTEDILKTLGDNKGKHILVGFAAETHNLREYAMEKVRKKNLDFICANKVGIPGSGFGSDTNAVTVIYPDGKWEEIGPDSKHNIALAILDRVRKIALERNILENPPV